MLYIGAPPLNLRQAHPTTGNYMGLLELLWVYIVIVTIYIWV